MKPSFALALGLLSALALRTAALEAVGVVERVDLEKHTLHLRAAGQDRVVRIAADVEVIDANDPLAGAWFAVPRQ